MGALDGDEFGRASSGSHVEEEAHCHLFGRAALAVEHGLLIGGKLNGGSGHRYLASEQLPRFAIWFLLKCPTPYLLYRNEEHDAGVIIF